MKQDDIFLKSEGNNWFSRNKDSLANKKKDFVLDFLLPYELMNNTSKVLEVGCASGYRLNKINEVFGAECFGLEASADAVSFGQKNYENIKIEQGAAELLPFEDEKFDVVIINFVLHWIDRKNLLKVVAELDRVIKKDGFLLIGDFLPVSAEKRIYHHIQDREVFTFKQPYHEIFVSSKMYDIVELTTFSHEKMSKAVTIDPNDRCSLTLLKKCGNDLYVRK